MFVKLTNKDNIRIAINIKELPILMIMQEQGNTGSTIVREGSGQLDIKESIDEILFQIQDQTNLLNSGK